MPMKILLAGSYDDWSDLAPTRWNQPLRNRLAADLRLIAEQIANNLADAGGAGPLRFRLEPEAKSAETGEAA